MTAGHLRKIPRPRVFDDLDILTVEIVENARTAPQALGEPFCLGAAGAGVLIRKRCEEWEPTAPYCVTIWTTSYSRFPLGVSTTTSSEVFLPMSALAMGESTDILPLFMSDSSTPTIW